MTEPQKDPKTPPGILQRRGGIWTVLGMLLVAGIAVVWMQKNLGVQDDPDTPPGPQAPRNLLIISIDTLRADHMGTHDYEHDTTPAIDKLAANGVVFERHYSSNPLTLPAHLTQFTGVSGLGHRVRDNLYHSLPDELGTLAEVMKAEGFETGAFVSAHTMKSGSGIERGFARYDDEEVRTLQPGRLTVSERSAPRTLELAGDWVASQGADRFFCFVHLFDPHAPYVRHDGITERFGDDTRALYDGEIAFTDAAIGRFVERLRTLGVLEQTLLVITADHGEGLGDHGELTHGYYCYDTTTHVPLIIHGAPGIKAGTRIPHIVRNYDLAPTLVELMQLKDETIKKQAHGQSLVAVMKDPATDPGLEVFVESHYAWLNAGWARIRGLRTKQGLTLFSGAQTLHYAGRQDKPVDDAAAVRHARDEVTRLMNAWVPPRKGDARPRESTAGSPYPGEVPVAQNFDPESLNDSNELPSPHQMKEVLRAYQEAELAYDAERFADCAAQLRLILADHPQFMMAGRLLASVTQGMVQNQWRELSAARREELSREAATWLKAAASYARDRGQPDGALAADVNRALLLAWLGDTQELAALAQVQSDPRIEWMSLLAEYRAGGGVDMARANEVFDSLPFSGTARESAQRHLQAMRNAAPVTLAPWER